MDVGDPRTVTVIGLGNMGLPMARRLREAGHRVHGFDRSPAAMSSFDEGVVSPTPSLGDAVAVSDIVVTMLPDGSTVRSALLDPQVFNALRKRRPVVIDMSSSAPTETRDLCDALGEIGVALLDAPVSGGVPRARDGTLTIMVGGDERVAAAMSYVLSAMGTDVVHVGQLGAGHAMKALNNFVSAAGLTAAAEAVVIGERFGIAPATLIDVLNGSTGRNNATENKFARYILNGAFDSGFLMRLMSKDLDIASGLSNAIGADMPILDAVRETWANASSSLGTDADHTEIYRFAAALAESGGPKSTARPDTDAAR